MSRSLTELAEELLTLRVGSRAFLAEKLLETRDLEDDCAINDAWRHEIQKRCQELDQELVQTVPAEAAIAELRQSLR